MVESSVLKKAYDRWQSGKAPDEPRDVDAEETPLSALLGLAPEVVEEFATLANRVELALAGAHRRTILVGSPVRRTGASTVAIGLAATLATNSGARTLLVDANLRQPSLHEKFNLERSPGLSETVRGRAPASGPVHRTAVQRLELVTAGAPVENPQGFFQAASFAEQLERWSAEYTYVILDSAPFGGFSEPMNLAQLASGVVLVVEAARTSREVAGGLVDSLRDGGVRVLGAVLNKRKFYIPEWIYRRV
jgi:capsular exopolysaccharide synthesis family protein